MQQPRSLIGTAFRIAVATVVAGSGALALTGPAEASTAGDAVVISEVYGGGGNSGAPYQNDFIELYNPTDHAVSLAGMSVQYRSAAGGLGGLTTLSGSLPAGQHWLVGEGAGAGNGAPLPTPDASGALNMAAGAGIVVLASSTTAVLPHDASVIDLVGYGSTASAFEGAPTANLSNTSSASRNANGTDTDNNSNDFSVGAPTPTPSGATGPSCPGGAMAIADIQGDTDASPCVNVAVTTEGVVTAAYPTGGFNGFYLQSEDTGGDLDLTTHTRSDGIFVFSSAAAAAVQVGDHVQVSGNVSEFNGLTELIPASAAGVTVLGTPALAVKPATVALPATAAQRESLEGMLVSLQGPFTVTDNFSLNQFAEIGLAAGTAPLWQPTEVADPHDAAAIAAVVADNAAHRITLDDGATTNFLNSANKATPLPWLTQDHQIRIGAPATFVAPMVLDFRNSAWKLQPTSRLTANDEPPVAFAHTRTATPGTVGGDVQIASFNVLNYFPTTGADWVAGGGSCTFFDDRDGNHITVNDCGPTGPRGAADATSLARQQAKIVHAINGLGADVVSLEEIENSAKFGEPRDAAVSTLVDALNADAGAGTWAFVPTPSAIGDQTDEDVIRTAFIYRTAAVEPIGESVVDDAPEFDIARDPLAQAFEPVGATSASRFVVIVNHFKSKSSGPDDGTGQGSSNPQRIAQAQQLVGFADQMKAQLGSAKVFLSGDFNAYTREDPIEVLADAGYTDIGSTEHPEEHTYLFGGVVGSLDHVLANDAALGTVTGAHVWNINSVEPVALEYSRYNYNATLFYEDGPFRASDHDPLVVGLDSTAPAVATTTTADVSPDPVPVAKKRVAPGVVTVQVSSPQDTVDAGTVEVYDGATLVGTATVSASGAATINLPAYKHKGTHVLTVRYLGTPLFEASQTTVGFVVGK